MRAMIVGEAKLVTLTKGFQAKIDESDYNMIMEYKWYADVSKWNIYAKTDQIIWRPRMHALIMRPTEKLVVHHKNGDGLDNTRENLEVMTQAEHSRLSRLRKNKNGSEFRGVYYHRTSGKYCAELWVNYQKHYLGSFENPIEAAAAYDRAAEELLGSGKYIPNFT